MHIYVSESNRNQNSKKKYSTKFLDKILRESIITFVVEKMEESLIVSLGPITPPSLSFFSATATRRTGLKYYINGIPITQPYLTHSEPNKI